MTYGRTDTRGGQQGHMSVTQPAHDLHSLLSPTASHSESRGGSRVWALC